MKKKKKKKKQEEKQCTLFLEEAIENTEITMYEIWRKIVKKNLIEDNGKEFFSSINYSYPEELKQYNSVSYDLLSFRFATEYNSKNPDDKIVFVVDKKLSENGKYNAKPIFYNKLVKEMKDEGVNVFVIVNAYIYSVLFLKISIDKLFANMFGVKDLPETSDIKKKVLEDK